MNKNAIRLLAAAAALAIFTFHDGARAGRDGAEAKPAAANSRYFAVQVVDDATGRGVPLVELKTTNSVAFYTDSNGVVALGEPGFMNRKVFFHIASHGYEYPADGFGHARHDARSHARRAHATVKIKRLNIAERCTASPARASTATASWPARVPIPIHEPLLNAQVTGQDSIQAAIYHNKIYWIWGDTNRLRYPLGHFWMSGATSDLPGQGRPRPGQRRGPEILRRRRRLRPPACSSR